MGITRNQSGPNNHIFLTRPSLVLPEFSALPILQQIIIFLCWNSHRQSDKKGRAWAHRQTDEKRIKRRFYLLPNIRRASFFFYSTHGFMPVRLEFPDSVHRQVKYDGIENTKCSRQQFKYEVILGIIFDVTYMYVRTYVHACPARTNVPSKLNRSWE